MKDSLQNVFATVGLTVAFLCAPTALMAAGRGTSHTNSNSGHNVQNNTPHSTRGHTSITTDRRKRKSPSGPLSYNAYWKAANSPNPPRTNQDYNRYWEKMAAWNRYHE
jgi:hypothetical protein